MYQYFVKVVPTVYKELSGKVRSHDQSGEITLWLVEEEECGGGPRLSDRRGGDLKGKAVGFSQ